MTHRQRRKAGIVGPVGCFAVPTVRRDEVQWIAERIVPQPNGCWAWKGHDLTSYVNVASPHHHSIANYRLVYQVCRGSIPDGHHLHHECRNPGCCNPNHLVPLTGSDHSALHQAERRRA